MISRHALLTVAVFAAAAPFKTLDAQATNPPYLAAFPTAERVKQAMKAGDPRETAVRQIGALYQLEEIIRQLSGSREFRGFLPDEARIIGEYQVASYYIAQAIDKAYPGPYMQSASVSSYTPYRFARSDGRFGVDGIEVFKTFLNPSIQGQFAKTVGVDIAKHEARQKADQEAIASIGTIQSNGATGQPKSKLAEEQAGIRRCVEAGRSETACMMEGLGKSAMGMVNGVLPGLAALKEEPVRGLRLAGIYPGTNKFELRFQTDIVGLGCSELASAVYPYSVKVTGSQVSVTVMTSPRPIVLSVRSDGKLVGPGPTDITGEVQVGTQYGTRTYSDGRTEPISRPVMETQTRRCNIGTLAASGPTTPLEGTAGIVSVMNMMLGGGIDKNTQSEVPVGLRVAGEWGSQSAFDVEFRPEGVIVGCREITKLTPYTVQVGATGVAINVQLGSTPFKLTMGSDGRLTGPGTVRVDGRAVVGTDGSGALTYVPRSESCAVGVLSPAAPSQ
jgi:hypothetical protein